MTGMGGDGVDGLLARLLDDSDPEIGRERIEVRHGDGRVEQLYLHDYERLYELPGVYEAIVQERLGCRSPAVIAQMLGEALDALGRTRSVTRVIDVAAGNGVSGEALRAEGIAPVLGTDIVHSARPAALRDRPGVYGEYLTVDLLALTDEQIAHVRGLGADALTCVAPVGDAHEGQVPSAAFAAIVGLVSDDAVVVHMHDPGFGPDAVDATFWEDHGLDAQLLSRRRYLHRRTVTGDAYEMDGLAWRVRRRVA